MKNERYSNDLKWLARGPIIQARRFGAYNVNGYKFRTVTKEEKMKPQNSGVYVSSNSISYASKRQKNVAVDDVVDKEWSVVVHVKPRDLFDMGEDNELAEVGFTPESGLKLSRGGDIENLQLAREEDN
ncbi:hypothetical protein PIB30_008364 [Stylosanthes scabra]|uniref:DUF4216 domain-containing protein n=1 Tax=Stylosanthes scabra TaxID=79078 RepID=A0ABU6U5U1_9FABA|nr:hypothetical protein [Stylosanthes scabra]